MKLYDLKTGTNTRRVRIFLAEKGLKLPTVEVDMMKGENNDPEYLSKNPMGTMPLLELDDGTQLAESVAICRYVEELHPDPPLFGTTPIERALIEMWNRRMELELMIPIIDHFVHSSTFYKERLSQVADIAHRGHMRAQARMRWLDGELAMRPFIAGNRYTIADITAQCALILGRIPDLQFPAIHNILRDGSVMCRRDQRLEREARTHPPVESSSRDLRFGHSVRPQSFRVRGGWVAAVIRTVFLPAPRPPPP